MPPNWKSKKTATHSIKLKNLTPALRSELNAIYTEIISRNLSIRITDTLRTFAQQQKLYDKGRTTPGSIVTNAKPGQSYHNFGLAVDFAILLTDGRTVSWDMDLDLNVNHQKDWDEVVSIFKHFGWKWGGNWVNFKDYPHFEKTFGYSTSQLLNKHKDGDITSGYVNL